MLGSRLKVSDEERKFTELTDFTMSAPVPGSFAVTLTTQAPQPPSLHMYLVPLSRALSRMKSTSRDLELGRGLAGESVVGSSRDTAKANTRTMHFFDI